MKKIFIFLFINCFFMACAANIHQSIITNKTLSTSTTPSNRIALIIEGSTIAKNSSDWQLFRAEWRTGLYEAAVGVGMNFSFFDTDIPPETKPTILIILKIDDYRYITTSTRYSYGAMTGNAFMDIGVDLVELPARRLIISKKYKTSSSAWQGIFSAMTDKQIRAISDDIINCILQNK